jgi:MarR family 2-MHQ and catechol resistance regulon transcriptional repressor
VLEASRRYHEEFGSDADAVAIILGLQRAHALLLASVENFVDSLGLGVNLSLGRLRMLRAIYFGENHMVTLNDLGRLVKVSRTNITNLIDAMERDGLVRRTINVIDRRVINAELTPKGLDICGIVLPRIARYMEDVTQVFTSEEKESFVDLFSRLQGELASRGDADDTSF